MEFDLHVHTKYSFDSSAEPEEIVEYAIKAGLAGIAVTDHDTIQGIAETTRLAGGRLLVIPGVELSTDLGDIIGYFIKKEFKLEDGDPLEAIRAIKGQGGLVCLPHPTRLQLTEIEDKGLVREFDLIEAFNARRHKLGHVLEFGGEPFILDFAERHGLVITAGSDTHTPVDVGSGRTVMPASTLDEVRRALIKGNTVLTGRKTGWIAGLFDRFKPDVEPPHEED
jgi:predicted metal-dependent phosphoesterase TrpH